MKTAPVISPGHQAQSNLMGTSSAQLKFALRGVCLLLLLPVFAIGTVYGQAVDPGPRGGSVGAGLPVAGLSADQQRFFATALSQFTEVQDVQDPSPGNGGLGPTFNSNSCGSCHSQPAMGGTSPSTSAYPFVGPNPQVVVATLMGATNTLPSFVTPDGPVREARFKYFYSSRGDGRGRRGFGGPLDTDDPDGGVHDLFTIAGRSDAPGCVYPQEDFARAQADGNLSLRIPTPVFGVGLIENISDATILANLASTASGRAALGIGGVPNRSGNDGTIDRLGWKAQNKSGLIFAGEAYNVEIGITNEIFTNERGFGGVPPPASCMFNPTPEDTTIFVPNDGTDTSVVNSDINDFAIFMRFLDQPTPACTGTRLLGFDSERRDAVRQGWLRDVPHAVNDHGRFGLRARCAQQRAGEPLLRSRSASHGRGIGGRHLAGQCRPRPVPNIAALGHRATCLLLARRENFRPASSDRGARQSGFGGERCHSPVQRPHHEPETGFIRFLALALKVRRWLACGASNVPSCQPILRRRQLARMAIWFSNGHVAPAFRRAFEIQAPAHPKASVT